MSRIQGIYLIDCGTEKVYIGQSVNIQERLTQHKSKLKLGKHYNYKLQNEFNLTKSLSCEILEEIGKEEYLYQRESYYIELYDSINNGLNISEAGISGRGLNHGSSIYSKEQIVKAFTLLLDIDNKVSYIADATDLSESTVRHISRGEVHYWLSEEYPEEYSKLMQISKSRLRNSSLRGLSTRYASNRLISPEGSVYILETSVSEFARQHNLDGNKLGQVLLGNRNMHKGWRVEGLNNGRP